MSSSLRGKVAPHLSQAGPAIFVRYPDNQGGTVFHPPEGGLDGFGNRVAVDLDRYRLDTKRFGVGPREWVGFGLAWHSSDHGLRPEPVS